MGNEALKTTLSVGFDSALIALYVGMISVPATAVALGEVNAEVAVITGIFAGLPQGLRHLLKVRGLSNEVGGE